MSAPMLQDDTLAGEVGAFSTLLLRDHLRELHIAASAVPIRTFEEDEQAPLDELRATADVLLAASVDLLELVVRRVDTSARPADLEVGPSSILYREIDARLLRSTNAAGVADVAAVGRMVLRGRQVALSNVGLPGALRWEVVDVTAGALRALKKAVGAVDAAVARLDDAAAISTLYLSEVARSLLVRREYFRFRRDLLALGRRFSPPQASRAGSDVDAQAVRARLRSAGNLIARVVGAETYEHLRTKDRAMLRALQGRIRAYLLGTAAGIEQRVDGVRIWQDVELLAELFAGVNRREDLVQHDTTLFSRELAALDASPEPDDGTAPPSAVERLRAALGRDDELDEVLSRKLIGLTTGELRAAVRRASEGLSRHPLGVGSGAPSAESEPEDDFF